MKKVGFWWFKRISVSQMFLHLQPNPLRNSPELYPSSGHRTTRHGGKTMKLTRKHMFEGLFLVVVFHNCFTK